MTDKRICEYCDEGLCAYFRSKEDQWGNEQDGIPGDYCDGFEEYQEICFGNGDILR